MVLGSTASALTPLVIAQIGFDGILVALLGRVKPWGVLLAALLFGALSAGGNRMQSYTGISLELVTVLQALIVIFIAAPALVKAIFRLRAARAGRAQTKPREGLVTPMSTTTVAPAPAVTEVSEGYWTRNRKVGLLILALGVLAAVIFGALATDQQARFTLSEDAGGAALEINGTFGAILFGIIAAAAGAALLAKLPGKWFLPLLAVGVIGFVLSFLCWQVSAAPAGQNFMPLVNMVRGTFLLALPLIFGALAGVLCERSGVVNVAIEGQLLMGAFSGALFGTISQQRLGGSGRRRLRRRVHLGAAGRASPSGTWSTRSSSASCSTCSRSASPASSTSG